jgi:hypothetical protein
MLPSSHQAIVGQAIGYVSGIAVDRDAGSFYIGIEKVREGVEVAGPGASRNARQEGASHSSC